MDKEDHSTRTSAAILERRLAAILSMDVQGFSHLMEDNEEATLRMLTVCREVTDALIQQHRGRIVGTAGDSVLAEFASVVDAVRCAVEMQRRLRAKNIDLPVERRMQFRIGINLGDVMVDGEQIYGDGVNVAARLESLAEPGGVCISGTVYDQVKNKLALTYDGLGEQTVKNIAELVRVYRVGMEGEENQKAKGKNQKAKVQDQDNSMFKVQQGCSRVRPAHRWVTAGLLLIAVTILAVRYLPFPSTQHPAPGTQALPLPDKPSIVVLPFANMSNDPEQEYFSDGLTEDITSDLSKISSLFVIARNSAFSYKGKSPKVQDVSREMGVRYVLEGSVRKANDQVRITAQLIDATTGGHLWSERYDRALQDIFALQDEIRQKIVLALKVKLTSEEQGRFKRAPTTNLEAYDFYLRGWESTLRALHERKKEANVQARQLYEKAIALDPSYAGAYAGLGWSHFLDWFYLWNTDRAQTLDRASELAQKAVTLDDSLSMPHWILSLASLWNRQHEEAIVEGERAVALDANGADSSVSLGNTLVFAGRAKEGVELIQKAMRLNPHYPPRYLNLLGLASRMAGQCEEAIVPLKKAVTLEPDFLPAHFNLAACYAELDQLGEARAEIAEVLRLNPNSSVELNKRFMPFKDPADMERTLAALRKAGLK